MKQYDVYVKQEYNIRVEAENEADAKELAYEETTTKAPDDYEIEIEDVRELP